MDKASCSREVVALEETHKVDSIFIHEHYIPELYIDTLQNSCYLPKLLMRDCLQPARIKATIKSEEDLLSYTDDDKDKLFKYAKHNPRLFLILAVSSLIKKLPRLLESKFTQADLPLNSIYRKGRLVVYSASDPKKTPWTCFEIEKGKKDTRTTWLINDVNAFITHQWAFSAAVLEPGRFDYKFHHKCPLPYVDLSDESDTESPENNHNEGHFGTVYKLGLRADHISSVSDWLLSPNSRLLQLLQASSERS